MRKLLSILLSVLMICALTTPTFAATSVNVANETELKDAIANYDDVEIVFTASFDLTNTLTIPAGKTVVFNLNGNTLSQKKACTGSYSMIQNNGNLEITGNGKISFENTNNGGGDVWGTYTISNGSGAKVVVQNGTVEHLGSLNTRQTDVAIQNYQGTVVINGGTISSPEFRSIRDFTAGGSVIINGGTIIGQVWMQGLGSGSSKLEINGGSFEPAEGDGSSVFITNGTNDVEIEINGGYFKTKIGCTDPTRSGVTAKIVGGEFANEAAVENTHDNLFANTPVKNEDGSYSVNPEPEQEEPTTPTITCAGSDDKNCDGVVTCDEVHGEGWDWNNITKACEFFGTVKPNVYIVDTATK